MAFINRFKDLTALKQKVYTAPAGKEAVIHAIFVTPKDGVSSTLISTNVEATDLSLGYIGRNIPLVEGGTLYYPKPVNLAAGESLECACASDGDAEIFASILEQDAS